MLILAGSSDVHMYVLTTLNNSGRLCLVCGCGQDYTVHVGYEISYIPGLYDKCILKVSSWDRF